MPLPPQELGILFSGVEARNQCGVEQHLPELTAPLQNLHSMNPGSGGKAPAVTSGSHMRPSQIGGGGGMVIAAPPAYLNLGRLI